MSIPVWKDEAGHYVIDQVVRTPISDGLIAPISQVLRYERIQIRGNTLDLRSPFVQILFIDKDGSIQLTVTMPKQGFLDLLNTVNNSQIFKE